LRAVALTAALLFAGPSGASKGSVHLGQASANAAVPGVAPTGVLTGLGLDRDDPWPGDHGRPGRLADATNCFAGLSDADLPG
jgi:hypothetical protein